MANRISRPLALVALLALAVAASCLYQGKSKKIPVAVGEEAIRRTSDLKVGMAESVVFKTLGLEKYGLHARSYGSGPKDAWPTWYFVTPDRAILCRWDLRKSPPTLVRWA